MLYSFLSVGKNNKEFWFSHLLIIVSTVFAVYLAAKAGLQTAIEFEQVQSSRNSYYLQSSLMNEFKDNTDQIIAMCKGIEEERYGLYLGQQHKHDLDTYVWTAMQDSADTFEIPSSILTGVRRLYRNADKTITTITQAEYGQYWNNNYAQQVPLLLAQTKKAQTEIIPKMQKELQRLKVALAKNDIEVE